MNELPLAVYVLGAAGLLALCVFGARGLLDIRDALRSAEFERLASPSCWSATRALPGSLAAIPLMFAIGTPAVLAVAAGLAVGALGYWLAPRGLAAARRGVERQILDDLPLHLDLLALTLESGGSWTSSLSACIERAPEGALRRAWERVLLEIQAGAEPLEALRRLEQRTRLSPFVTLVSALRAAEKLQLPAAQVLRDRARQSAATRFARAERAARAAPVKLWATMLLCLAPCTAVVLAYPLAQFLATLFG